MKNVPSNDLHLFLLIEILLERVLYFNITSRKIAQGLWCFRISISKFESSFPTRRFIFNIFTYNCVLRSYMNFLKTKLNS